MLMAVIFETSIYQVPYIRHFAYPQDILFVGLYCYIPPFYRRAD